MELEHVGVKGMKWGIHRKYGQLAGMAYDNQDNVHEENRLKQKVGSYVGYELRDRIFKLKGQNKKLVALVQTKKGLKRVKNLAPRLAKVMQRRMTAEAKMEAKREEIRQTGMYDNLLEQKLTKRYKETMDTYKILYGGGVVYY